MHRKIIRFFGIQKFRFDLWVGIVILFVTISLTHAQIIKPEKVTHFPVGIDYKLARWETITEYLRLLAADSDRVTLEERGKTTEGLDFVLVLISSPENLANLEHYKTIQRQLADPRGREETELDGLCREGKAVVLINCNLHSTEVASSQMSMELAYQLATMDTPEVKEILENVILLLIPSTNPDGLNMVVDWYNRTLGTPYEGSSMPWLYHKYTGHDNNRDWFMLTQVETQIVTEILYEEWFPEVVYDVHQMGNSGARFVIPPYFDPVNPNIPPILQRTLALIGTQLAFDLTSNGFTGVLSNAVYDTWWHGGFRTVPYRHNMVGILTEAASVNIASPIFQPKASLKGHRRGLGGYAQQTNFPEPWPGGWWRLRDIMDYEEAAAYSILSSVAKRKETFLKNFYKMGLSAVEKGKDEPPRAFLMPTAQRQPNTALKMLEILQRGGVEIHQANANFTADGVEYPQGTYVISMAQPFRAHAKDLLEAQRYPQRRASPNAPPERPYDITGWTLPLQMGVRVVKVINEFEAELKRVEKIPKIQGKLHTIPETVAYFFKNQTNAETIALNRLLKEEEYTLHQSTTEHAIGNQEFPRGSILVTTTKIPSQVGNDFQELAESLGIEIYALNHIPFKDPTTRLSQPRLGLYKPWVANIDEGWTRWVLEQHEFVYRNLTDAEIRAGSLAERYDVIILPDMRASAMIDGHAEGTLPPEYVGGIGSEGAANLRTFVVNGGTLICLNRATELPDKYFGLEITNVLDSSNQSNRKESEVERFFCPGSLLRIFVKKTHPIGYGLSREMAAFFKSGPAFEVRGGKEVASYPDFNPLMSGWIQGDKQIRRKGALWDVNLGEGHVILFGFKPQHRAQAHGTFKLLFNAIYYGVTGK
ncbi:hypothetical protein IH992_10575 [Candidatus Poribacteria bacterium]|nr:hypothetical protein [Candidatus Poribacteria bacterium]